MQTEKSQMDIGASTQTLVASYQEATRLLTQACGLLKRSESQGGKPSVSFYRLPAGRSNIRSIDLEHTIAEYRRTLWGRILSRMFMAKRISPRRFRQVQARIQAGEVPELTVENIQRVVQGSPPEKLH